MIDRPNDAWMLWTPNQSSYLEVFVLYRVAMAYTSRRGRWVHVRER